MPYKLPLVCPEHYARILWRDIGHKALMPYITGRDRGGRYMYSYAHTDGGTHAGVCLLSRTVDPVRIPPVAAEQPPGRQQRHH